ncbi:MAG: 30S ribosomal protein S9 [Minisyncoccia bacterium]
MTDRYTEAVGRRKTAIARVRITPASKVSVLINEKELEKYFPVMEMQDTVLEPFSESPEKFSVTVKVSGGGAHSQSEAIRHGIARAIVEKDSNLRRAIKKAGYLKRDPRAKERRKFGLKKARKAPKWSKR